LHLHPSVTCFLHPVQRSLAPFRARLQQGVKLVQTIDNEFCLAMDKAECILRPHGPEAVGQGHQHACHDEPQHYDV
jgi:hypothetical protein